MIRVYLWDNAPKSLRNLSTHGGDEDYIVVGTLRELGHSPFRYIYDATEAKPYLDAWGHAQVVRQRGRRIIIFAHA